jgi:hypothetical protein
VSPPLQPTAPALVFYRTFADTTSDRSSLAWLRARMHSVLRRHGRVA